MNSLSQTRVVKYHALWHAQAQYYVESEVNLFNRSLAAVPHRYILDGTST